ncbi:uncharacterized protein LOC106646012 [Copidosoma floridanum]|uniref:uncharacterized protein LOC106646012 n=1 Tax=Copidosoma floridanum TaxID=29053 RepID=UPI0006C98F44|nr:uncharacterized protein LOC106646012 [Copidosoma floridanum]
MLAVEAKHRGVDDNNFVETTRGREHQEAEAEIITVPGVYIGKAVVDCEEGHCYTIAERLKARRRKETPRAQIQDSSSEPDTASTSQFSDPQSNAPIPFEERSFMPSLINALEEETPLNIMVPSKSSSQLTPEKQDCEEHFVRTHSRDSTGRYVVKLPLKQSPSLLGNSVNRARKCFDRTVARLKTDDKYDKLYTDFMNKYLSFGHMRLVPADELNIKPHFYLPHHGVLKEDGDNAKLRVVFNGSALTSSGHSLNSITHTGPNLLPNITDILFWLRTFKLTFSEDISKMYHQIKLTTVTYGTRPASFLVTRSLLQLVKDGRHRYPQVAWILTSGRYVDDIFNGAETPDELNEQALQLNELCMAGGLPLAKWHLNLPGFSYSNSSEESALSLDDCNAKVLGVVWKPMSDNLTFQCTLKPLSQTPTTRTILSEISKIFDPLGIVASRWLQIRGDLAKLFGVTVPRWLGAHPFAAVELHGFADASQDAMGAVIYLVIKSDSATSSSFVCSKTKVSPLKRMSIPRLEFTAALVQAKLTKYVTRQLTLNISNIHLWTDSSVILYWISFHPNKWKDFVRNRVAAIQDLVPAAHWKHVPGKKNAFDCASRGILTSQLIEHRLWWHGPSGGMIQPQDGWPLQPSNVEVENKTEARQVSALVSSVSDLEFLLRLIQSSSTLHKLYRITAILLLACAKFKECFKEEIKMIKSGYLPKGNVFHQLMAYTDNAGILREGGRLMNAKLRPDAKHAAPLPRQAHFTSLVIDEAHWQTLHGGTQLTLCKTRQEFWIIGGRAHIRSRILNCVECARYRAQRAQQLMGQLP